MGLWLPQRGFQGALATRQKAGNPMSIGGLAWDETDITQALPDVSGWPVVFTDNFNDPTMQNIAWRDGSGPTDPSTIKWYVPQYGYGNSFGAVNPWTDTHGVWSIIDDVTASDGKCLRWNAQIASPGDYQHWNTGKIQTAREDTLAGFQGILNGYMKARLKWDLLWGMWPSFWLYSDVKYPTGNSNYCRYVELDVIEWYGRADPDGHHHTNWSHNNDMPFPGDDTGDYHIGDYTGVHGPPSETYPGTGWYPIGGQWHDWEVLLEPDRITMGMDGKVVSRMRRWSEAKRLMFLVLALQFYDIDGSDTAQLTEMANDGPTRNMYVDKVEVRAMP